MAKNGPIVFTISYSKSAKSPIFQCIHGQTKLLQISSPFRPFPGKCGLNSAADLSGRSFFYSIPFNFMLSNFRPVGNTAAEKDNTVDGLASSLYFISDSDRNE